VQTAGGDGEWALPDPIDPNWQWADSENGVVTVYNKETKDTILVMPYIERSLGNYNVSLAKYRFNWDSPIAFAPWNGHIAWVGANAIFQSTDRGIHWKVISPDLTLNLKSHQQPSGGPLVHDVSGAEYSDTIIYIEGSVRRKGEIWVGTDDGLVQLTLDGGKHWKNVTPPGVPPYGRVETVAPSVINDGTAYVNIDRHRSGDFKPYVFVTHDFGKHWASIVNNLPQDQYIRSIRQDLRNPRLVYAGTEAGMWISFDGGGTWHDFRNNLPTVSVRDIRIQPEWDDLIIATHGRALYIMDDLRSVQHLSGATTAAAQSPFLIAPRTAYQYNLHSDDEGTYTDYTGQNPPYGATVFFYQREPMKGAPEIQILDAHRHVIRTVKGTHKVAGKQQPWVSNKAGINAYTWDFQIDGPVKWYGAAKVAYQGPNEGPGAPPGRYFVRMTLAGRTYTEPFTVKADPRTKLSQTDFERVYAFQKKYFHEFSVVNTMLNALDSVKKDLQAAQNDVKTKSNAVLQRQIDGTLASRQTLFSELTADYHNDEDSIQRPGALREDIQSAQYLVQGVLTPAALDYGRRVDLGYHAAVQHYNAFVRTLSALQNALRTAGLKVPSANLVTP
jgi:hypothetical protein